MGNSNLFGIFLTGLLTGGLSCMAVQGGLLAATLAQREEEKLKEMVRSNWSGKNSGNALPIFSFLVTKLIAYTLFGFLLGWLGSFFQLSIQFTVILQFAVIIFMLGTALNILGVHPIFRYFVIQPPKFLTRLVRKKSKSKDIFAPAMLGAFTIFIPCGITQAMMALAIASGKPLVGAAILFAFILGTSPVFFILGYFATKLGDMFHKKFMQIAAYAIILLAVFNLNNSIALTGSNLTIGNMLNGFWCTVSFCSNSTNQAEVQQTVQEATITIGRLGYNPNELAVKAGSQVTLHLTNTDGAGCQQSFTIPQLGVQKVIPVGSADTIVFTAPSNTGQISFMCSMGMYRGVINVI